ncbi:MAG: hypothetical protein ACXW11_10965 [Methylotenera sp.]
MSREEDDFRELRRLLEDTAANAKVKSDFRINLIDNVSAQFDDGVALQKVKEKETKNRGVLDWLKFVLSWPFAIFKLLNYGPPCTDPITQNFIEELCRKGIITRAQTRLLNVYKMVRFDPNGSCLVFLPSSQDYSKAKVMVGVLLILTPLLAFVVWEVAACILPGLPFGYVMGATLGLLWRGAYNYAWGRKKLAKYISEKYPWFKTTYHGLAA